VAKDKARMGDFLGFFLGLKFMLKNYLLKNVTFFSLNKKLKLKMHSAVWTCSGQSWGTQKSTRTSRKQIRDAKGAMRRYWNLMEDSRGTLGCPERGLAIEGF
jgi:hypothetical protein